VSVLIFDVELIAIVIEYRRSQQPGQVGIDQYSSRTWAASRSSRNFRRTQGLS